MVMIEAYALIKGTLGLASFVGAWATWRSMPLPATRIKMSKAFKAGDICIKRPGKKEIKIYPTVNSVSIKAEAMHVRFTLPLGLDPEIIHKHKYVFAQTFGERIDLEGDNRNFILTVHEADLHPFAYKFSADQFEGMHLPVLVGKSRQGWEIYDMVDSPHLLIAGETGAGKSTQLRSILTSWIQHFSPFQLRLYLADLKRTEFHLFKWLPHVERNEIDLGKTKSMLMKVQKELVSRGNLLNEHGESHITHLPESVRPPFIVVCIDEFALLKKDETCIDIMEEIAQQGRALGVFLILSCQRPDSKILEGTIKACLTVRMAFRHADEINSRITLGTGGAERIKPSEKGVLLLKSDSLKRVQAPLLEMNEAKKLLEPYKKKMPNGPVVDVEHHIVEEEITGVLE
jgi:S-DNA-T family DNA segregation ATPase FtsK/SpoIIIE